MSGAKVLGVMTLGLWACLSACTGQTPALEPAAPDGSKIALFYPLNGVVRGRGLPGALGPGALFLAIDPLPAGVGNIVEVAADGSFEFAIAATAGQVLSLASIPSDKPGAIRGAAYFIEVPPGYNAADPWVCCQPSATCKPMNDPGPCRGDPLAIRCAVDADCGVLSGETLIIPSESFAVGAPSSEGLVTITSVGANLPRDAIVSVENRGLAGIGEPRPAGGKVFRFVDDLGAIAPITLSARGDDEIVVQVLERNGYRSKELAYLVPDAELAGIDVVGVFPAEPLSSNSRGRVAVYLSPWGADGRGLCPNSEQHPTTCFSGGLTHGDDGMVTPIDAMSTIDDKPAMALVPALPPETLRGAAGDVRGPTLSIVVAIDLTSTCLAAAAGDPANRRITDVVGLLAAIGRRHRVQIIAFGAAEDEATGGVRELLQGFVQPTSVEVEPAILALRDLTPGTSATLLDAAKRAGELLVNEPNGRVILIGAALPPPDARARDALVLLSPENGTPRAVDVVGIGLTELGTAMEAVVAFTGGQLSTTAVADLPFALGRAATRVSGTFILVFDVQIPDGSGKTPPMTFAVDALVDGRTVRSPVWSGPLFVENAL